MSPDASAPAPGSFATSPAVVWDNHPSPQVLARLDAECFNPAWDAPAYARLLQEPTGCAWLVLDPQHNPVGWIACHRVAEEAEILRLGVLPAMRRQGWGQRLLEYALDRLAESAVGTVFLEVRGGNSAALALYGRAGFREIGRRRGYYRDPAEDAVLMGREI